MKKMKVLPKSLFVREGKDGDETYYLAYTFPQDAIEDDGPTLVGTYELVEEQRFVKRAQPA